MAHGAPIDRRTARRIEANLDGPGLARVTSDEAPVLKGRQVGVHRRRGGETDRIADLADGRRIATVTDLDVDELEDLLLAWGKSRGAHVGVPSLCTVGFVVRSRRTGYVLRRHLLISNRCSIYCIS